MFRLPDLPYAYDALEPTVSAETMRLHHDKHHKKYVDTTNQLCAAEGLTPASLEDLVVSARDQGRTKLFNNAAQAWNHAFFWSCMSPDGRKPQGELAGAIEDFGGLAALGEAFVKEGEGHFASGWVWLASTPSGLEVLSTHDGEDLIGRDGTVPLLTCDLWEHAYYVDYRNDRKAFLKAWFERLADWEFAAHQLAGARGRGEVWRFPAPTAEPVRRKA